MKPFIYIFGIKYPSYGLVGFIGIVLSILLVFLLSKKLKRNFSDYIYVYVFGLIGMIIGAKVLYIIVMIPEIVNDFKLGITLRYFLEKYVYSGLVFYGGLIGGILGAKIESKKLKLDFIDMYDILVPALALFAGIGRIGCFLTGCCYGKETSSIFGVIYHEAISAPNEVMLLPVQLFEAAFEFGFVIFILFNLKRIRRESILDIYLITYSLFRFFNEFLRGDSLRGIYLSLSTSQWISIGILIYEIVHICYIVKKNRKTFDKIGKNR